MAYTDIQKDRLSETVQTGLTATSNDVIVEPSSKITVEALLTAGSPTTGAKVQFTMDLKETIMAGTAVWVDTSRGNSLASFADTENAPSNITGVRLNVTNGTWTFRVRQGFVR